MSSKYLTIFNPTSTATFTATLPASPADGELHRMDLVGTHAAGTIIVFAPSGTQMINLSSNNLQIGGSNVSIDIVWSATLGSWVVG